MTHEAATRILRSGAQVEVTFEEEIIRRPKYEITRLQDKCEYCGKVAKSVSEKTIEYDDPFRPNLKFIRLDCGHTLVKKIPKGTPFITMLAGGDKNCKHEWNKAKCNHCGAMRPYEFQVDGMNFVETALAVNKGAALFDEMGLGKLLNVNTTIFTPSGPRRIGDIQIGDFVIGSDGNPTRVTGVFPQGEQDLYKIEFTDGSECDAGLPHLWQVNTALRKWQGLSPRILTTEQIMNDLFTKSKNSSGKYNYKWFIPIVKSVEFDFKEITIHPYILGVLLGNGSFVTRRVKLTTADEEISYQVSHYFKPTTKYNEFTLQSDSEIPDQLEQLKLIGCRAATKFVPEHYKFNAISVRIELLRGLMDTDGSIWKGGVVEYTTVSPNLADDVTFLVQSLGGIAKRTIKEEPKYEYKGEILIGQLAYRLVINIPINPFQLKRKADLWNEYNSKKKYEPTRAFKSITYKNKGESVCISVDAPNKLYVIKDFIVTHNTIQALGVIKFHPELHPVLYIVKSGIKFQWFKAIIDWMGSDFVGQIITKSDDYLIPNLKTYIVSYDLLVSKTRTNKKTGKIISQGYDISKFDGKIKTVVLDECQQIKNPDSSRTQQVRRIVKNKVVIALSGTPWKNRGSEFFSVLNMLAPSKFYSYEQYVNRWVERYWHGNTQKMGGINNPARFKEYVKDIVIRRERTEVMRELPLVNRTKLNIQMTPDESGVYDDAVNDFVEWYNEQRASISAIHILAKMSKLRHLTGLAKIPATLDYIEEFLEDTDRKLVVFLHHVDVGNMLYDSCRERFGNEIDILKLTGGMNSEERNKTQMQFNEPKRSILIASTLAAGEGLNLQTCADCIIHERQFNPANEEQAEGRFIRIGQTADVVNSTYAIAVDSIDEQLDMLVEGKRRRFHAAMNSSEAPKWNENDIARDLADIIVNQHKPRSKRKIN